MAVATMWATRWRFRRVFRFCDHDGGVDELVPCGSCGRPVAERARSCPGCGAATAWWAYRRRELLVGAIITAVVLAFIVIDFASR